MSLCLIFSHLPSKFKRVRFFLLDFYHFILSRRWKSEQQEDTNCKVGGTKWGILEGKCFFWKYRGWLSSDSISQATKLNIYQTVQKMCLHVIVNSSNFNYRNWNAYLSATLKQLSFSYCKHAEFSWKYGLHQCGFEISFASAWFQSHLISAIWISDLIMACDFI